ncbi:YppG family protein [Bacillus solitudinis]|uniref:YppG family protein n=1 Tax=Bacillus solitudinis TaxID=2014074 RepID=UPI000C250643|nr:YppG family protein [Bacillus solitudinis]
MFGPQPWYHQQQRPLSTRPPIPPNYSPQQRPPQPWGMPMHHQIQHFSNHPQGYQMPNVKKPSMFKTAFTSEDGKFDVGKTVQTVDQVVKTVHQVSPLVKQVGAFFIKK